jgi:hypothetical protein
LAKASCSSDAAKCASRLIFFVVVSLLFTGSASGSTERACDGSPVSSDVVRPEGTPIPTTPPSADDPTAVEIQLQITELGEIDALKSTFHFQGYADFRWCDPRSAFDAEAEGSDVQRHFGISRGYPIWNIDLSIANGVGAVEVTRRLIEVHSDGNIRVSGYFNSEVSAPFDLRLFPFDRQTLEIKLESFTYNEQKLVLVTNDDHVSFAPDLFLPEWRVAGIEARVEQTVSVRDRVPFSRAVIALQVDREWGFYVFKLWIPLLLIVALSWSIFWMHDESLAGRMRISATAFLTVVAYQFAISGSLPKIAYLTMMDRMMIASFVLIAFSALQSMPVAKAREKDPQRAVAIDRMSQWAFPLAYAGYIGGIAIVYLR